MSHTPGPWRVGRKVGRTVYCEEAGTDGRLIGVMDRVEDAQLVAAAPDLLEACIRTLSSGALKWPDNALDRGLAEGLRAAIAKATGDEP